MAEIDEMRAALVQAVEYLRHNGWEGSRQNDHADLIEHHLSDLARALEYKAALLPFAARWERWIRGAPERRDYNGPLEFSLHAGYYQAAADALAALPAGAGEGE